MADISLDGVTPWSESQPPYNNQTVGKSPYSSGQSPAGYGSSTMPASFGGPLPAGQTPPPSVNPRTVYTDASGQGYDPAGLSAAMANPAFRSDPLNARAGDILRQYSTDVGGTSPVSYSGSGGSPSGYNGTSIFSDPATSSYEQLLNGIINKLNTPYTPPDFGSTLGVLKSYIAQLNGPAYTPDQMNLFQTQAIDPIMAQRDADRQAIIQRFAAQGFDPKSGPVQSALMTNDQRYGAQADQARAQIAGNAVGLQKQQQANAMGYQLQIPTLETNLNSYNNQNALQAANLAGIIPNLAWTRSQAANTADSGTNPLGALQLIQAFQNLGANQGAQFSNSLMGVLPYLLPLFFPTLTSPQTQRTA